MLMRIILIQIIVVFMYSQLTGGSILLPYWQDDATPVYSFIVVHNTSQATSDAVDVMFYGKTGNPQAGAPREKTIPPANIELFGTNDHGPLRLPTGDEFGYVIVSDTGGMLIAVGFIYDQTSQTGYVIPCFPGDDNLQVVSGW